MAAINQLNSLYFLTIISECPTFRRNGKVSRGADLLNVWGYNARSAGAVGGSAVGYHAFGFSGAQKLAQKQLRSIFPAGLTQIFSVVFTAQLQNPGAIGMTIFDQGQDYASFAIQVISCFVFTLKLISFACSRP